VVHSTGLVRVELVDAAEVRVEAVEGVVLSRQREEDGRRARLGDGVRLRLDAEGGPQRRAASDDLLGGLEDDLRLIPGGRGRVDPGTALAVGGEHVERDDGEKKALAVAAGDLNVEAAESSGAAGRTDPTE